MMLIASSFVFDKRKLCLNMTNKNIHIPLCLFTLWAICIHLHNPLNFNIIFNIFLGIMVFYTIVMGVKKTEIPKIIKFMSFMAFLAIFWIFLQYCGWDIRATKMLNVANTVPKVSFFGLEACYGMYLCLLAPVLATSTWWIGVLCVLAILPSWSTGAILAGVVSILFYLWQRLRIAFWSILIPIMLFAVIFIFKIDMPMGMYDSRPDMWKLVIEDSWKKPVWGYGWDGFRSGKEVRYFKNAVNDKSMRAIVMDNEIGVNVEMTPELKEHIDKFGTQDIIRPIVNFWDNPHNELISILFEGGFISLFLALWVIYGIYMRFRYSMFDIYSVGFAASLLALFIVSMTQFPFHLARIGHLIPVLGAMFYISTGTGEDVKI